MQQANTDKIFLNMARELSAFSKCRSFQMGAIAIKDGRCIATGVNGTPSGYINCCDIFPPNDSPRFNRDAHRAWSGPREVHCEGNLLAQAAKYGIALEGCTVYITNTPCQNCLKHMIASGIKRIVYEKDYDRADLIPDVELLLSKCGVTLEKYRGE
jgi:dCMP deaminase